MELRIGSGSFIFEICVSGGDAMTPALAAKDGKS